MSARAAKTAKTAKRILDAALARFSTLAFDEVTLAAIAEDAQVTEQTVIRRFGGKDELFMALVEREGPRIQADRTPANKTQASLQEAIGALVDHYEKDGNTILNFLKQEARIAPLAQVTQSGRQVHEQWVRRYCAPQLKGCRGSERKRRLSALIVATDLYTWKLLRLDRGMSRSDVEKTMLMLIEGIAQQ